MKEDLLKVLSEEEIKSVANIEIANELAKAIVTSKGIHPSFRGDVDTLRHVILCLLEKGYKFSEMLQILNWSSAEDIFHIEFSKNDGDASTSTEKVETKAVDSQDELPKENEEESQKSTEEVIVEEPQTDAETANEVQEEPQEVAADLQTVESVNETTEEVVEDEPEKVEEPATEAIADIVEDETAEIVEESQNDETVEEVVENAVAEPDHSQNDEPVDDDSSEQVVKDEPEVVEKSSEKSNKTVEYKTPEEGDFNPDDSMIDDGADDLFNLSDDELDNLFNEDFDF